MHRRELGRSRNRLTVDRHIKAYIPFTEAKAAGYATRGALNAGVLFTITGVDVVDPTHAIHHVNAGATVDEVVTVGAILVIPEKGVVASVAEDTVVSCPTLEVVITATALKLRVDSRQNHRRRSGGDRSEIDQERCDCAAAGDGGGLHGDRCARGTLGGQPRGARVAIDEYLHATGDRAHHDFLFTHVDRRTCGTNLHRGAGERDE